MQNFALPQITFPGKQPETRLRSSKIEDKIEVKLKLVSLLIHPLHVLFHLHQSIVQ